MLATVPEMMVIDPQTSLECWREVNYSHASDHALELALMKQELLLSPAVVGLGNVGQALEVAEVVSVVVVVVVGVSMVLIVVVVVVVVVGLEVHHVLSFLVWQAVFPCPTSNFVEHVVKTINTFVQSVVNETGEV